MEDKIKGFQVNSKGFGIIPKLAMQDRNLHINAKAIYAYFNSFAGNGDTCFPTRKKICYDLGISNDTFSKYLKQLVTYGYIEVEQIKENGRFSHNVYTLCSTILPCPKISDTENIGNDKLDTNINSSNINNNSNKNNSNNKYDENFEKLWELLKSTPYDRKSKVTKKRKKELFEMGYERVEKAIMVYLQVQNPAYYFKRDNFLNEIVDNYLDKEVADFNGNNSTKQQKVDNSIQQQESTGNIFVDLLNELHEEQEEDVIDV